MGFVGVCKAIYDYAPQAEGELTIADGDLLYILDKGGEDGWWKAKKKAGGDDEDEPEGLIPENYVEEAQPLHTARALYDYTRQTDEEISFAEDAELEIYDTSDPDWILAGIHGDYGFVPANYIEVSDGAAAEEEEAASPPPALPARTSAPPEPEPAPSPEQSPVQSPAAALAGIIGSRAVPSAPVVEPPRSVQLPPRPPTMPEPEYEQEESPSPALPVRPSPPETQSSIDSYRRARSASTGVVASPPHNRVAFRGDVDDDAPDRAPGGFRMYNINEMVSVMGKNRKMSTTLGINLASGTIMIAPTDGPQQEWTAEKMTHYSIEGKHVFLELVRPSKSVDFHAGAKDTAEEIVSVLAELAGAIRAEGLREVIMAGTGRSQKKGQVLYDFMAQGDDEVTVAIGDEVIILDDKQSDEWWQVRRIKNGKEGVVPRSYIEVTGLISPAPTSAGINAGRSTVDQNRLEEERLAKEALKASRRGDEARTSEVGPGMRLPERGSSLAASHTNNVGSQRSRRESTRHEGRSKTKPDPHKTRTWTDRTKSFSVDAQFLALKEGKIHLHKTNGVKIAVPVAKMSVEDLEFVEKLTGVSLDEDKPLSDIKRQQAQKHGEGSRQVSGATIEKPKKPEYDWFQFFLNCDVNVGLCERYAQAFNRDSMDESVLPDVDATILRNLGLREGDILKVMRYIDSKYGRTGKKAVSFGSSEAGEGEGGLFSGPGGVLRNNTRKGRPAPAVQTNNIVDPSAFKQEQTESASKPSSDAVSTPLASAPTPTAKTEASGGFDDDAWEVKPIRQATPAQPAPQAATPQTSVPATAPAPAPAPAPPAQPTLTGSMQELSLLSAPLEPTKTPVSPQAPPQVQPAPPQPPQPVTTQPTGVTPGFFQGLGAPSNGIQPQPTIQYPPQAGFQTQQSIARQRPTPPQMGQNPNALVPPPPQRPLSAPQSAQQSAFSPPPLQPQMTGFQTSGGFQAPQATPPGQSLNEINQQRLLQQQQQQQQQMQGFMPQPTGMMPQPTGFSQFPNGLQQNGFPQQQMQPQATGFPQAQFMNPQATASPFSPIQPQATGFQSSFPQQYPQGTGINSFLQPALQPQKTGLMPQPTGMNGFGGQGFSAPPPPPIPQQPTLAPLQAQKTGPAPPVRFGVPQDAKKLTPQATGRRANLAAATPQNPFGF